MSERHDLVARRLLVHGRVQGVFFRASTEDVARHHGVRGWARNRSDGSVEVWLEGEPAAVDAVDGWIAAGGPGRARIDEVERWSVEVAGHEAFTTR